PLSARIWRARFGSGSGCLRARLFAIERLLERRVAHPSIDLDEGLVGGLPPLDVGVHQPFDGVRYVVGNKAGAHRIAQRRALRGVAADGDLVELGALLLDAENADMADIVVAAGIDAARNLDLELADLALPLGRGKPVRDRLRDGIERALASEQ